jgi:hypothetical protein
VRNLVRQFGPSVMFAVVVLVATGVAGALVFVRRRRGTRPAMVPTVRVLAAGWGLLIVAATGTPRTWPPRWDGLGDLILVPGRGGISEWKKVFEAPGSQPAMLLVANLALYFVLAFLVTIGWPGRVRRVLAGCLILSLIIEFVQFTLLDRVAAVDDVLLNMAGAVIGCILGTGIQRFLAARQMVNIA